MAGAIEAEGVVPWLLSKSPQFMFRAALWLIIASVHGPPTPPSLSYLPFSLFSCNADRGFNHRWRIDSFNTKSNINLKPAECQSLKQKEGRFAFNFTP